MKTVCVIQARMGSTRLPGKVLKNIAGKPLVQMVYQRTTLAALPDSVIVATTTDTSDDELAKFCDQAGIPIARGSVDDVLDRYYETATQHNADIIVRITGDCPFIDPAVIDSVITFFHSGRYDYVNNTNPPTFPDGLDTEVFTVDALKQAWNEATLTSEREHVTPYLYNNPEKFKLGNFSNEANLSDMRWTIDTAEDLSFVRKVMELLNTDHFDMNEITKLLKAHPELIDINAMFERNEGYEKSIREDNDSK